jgi:hypothetical protein
MIVPVRLAWSPSLVVAQQGDPDVALLEVEHHATHAVRQVQQLARHRVGEPVDAGDPVTHGQDGAGFLDRKAGTIALDLLTNDTADLVCSDFHRVSR